MWHQYMHGLFTCMSSEQSAKVSSNLEFSKLCNNSCLLQAYNEAINE